MKLLNFTLSSYGNGEPQKDIMLPQMHRVFTFNQLESIQIKLPHYRLTCSISLSCLRNFLLELSKVTLYFCLK